MLVIDLVDFDALVICILLDIDCRIVQVIRVTSLEFRSHYANCLTFLVPVAIF